MRFLACFAVAALVIASVGPASAGNSLGRSIDGFTLHDYRGKVVSLDEFSGSKAVVVGFLGTDCPLAKFYGPRLQRLADDLRGSNVAFIGINSNLQDSLTEISAYARRHKITFPILKDLGNQVADKFGATRTPEVFVLDADRTIRYQGRVDATFTFGVGVGLAQPNETRADLSLAIDEVLSGKPVSIAVTEAKGCLIGRSRPPQKDPTVTYSKEISRIIQNNCLECHREGQVGPFALDNYDEVAGWGDMIGEVVREQRMPPWHATGPIGVMKNDARLSVRDKELIQRWVDEGCPEGDPSDLPAERQFHEGWFVKGGPDEVFYISDKAVPVKAEGVEEYRYYEVDPGFKEDKWVRIAECMPGNRAVVHHIIAYARPSSAEPIAPGSTGVDTSGMLFLTGFAPGTRPLEAPEGWARLIPANHTLVIEMHYTPIGTAQTDRSGVGFVYMDESDVTHMALTRAAVNGEFKILPHLADQRVESVHKFNRDATVISLFPHMHLRGKSFRFELVAESGDRELLLDVPHYDFNWQNHYIFSTPRVMTKGSRLECTAYFDNSEGNLANPDPSKEVRWGPQSWDEMMIGFFDTGVPKEEAAKLLAELRKRRERR